MSSRDPTFTATTKLANEWSAQNFTALLSKELLQALLQKFETLDPLVRVRLLLSTQFLRADAEVDFRAEVQELVAAACQDKDEWVNVIGRSMGHLQGYLDLSEVCKHSKLVGKTMDKLVQGLEQGDAAGFRPLDEVYLSKRLAQASHTSQQEANRQHGHFTARAGAQVQSPRLSVPAAPPPPFAPAAAERSGEPASTSAGGAGYPRPKISLAAAEVDMFRSSRPVNIKRPLVSRPALGASEKTERKGAMRTVKTKQIDVNEAMALSTAAMESAADARESRKRKDPAEDTGHEAEGDVEEMEEGEVDPGEEPDGTRVSAEQAAVQNAPNVF